MIVTDHQPNRVDVTVFGEFSLADYKEFEQLVNFKVKFEGAVDLYFDLRQMADFTLDVAWEELVLFAPSKTLCDEDCAGLCPQCGPNSNTAPRACGGEPPAAEFGNSGFSGLVNLFPDLDPKRSKE